MGRETREQFMFGTEPIEAWRLWDVASIASGLNDDMERFVRAMAVATRKAPENPWEYMLAPRLSAVARADSAWEPRDPQRAVCTTDPHHVAPHLDCECGYWALKTEQEIATAALGGYNTADAVGRVNLWGRFCEFDKGYRAEYAYPVEVWLIGKQANAARAADLADMYGVPVHAGDPDFLVAERDRRKTAKADLPVAPINFSNILSQYTFGFSGGANMAKISWLEDAPLQWPAGIVKPNEFWDTIQNAGAKS
jgi:hypothetical protein